MTIASENSRSGPYVADGTQTEFPISFRVLEVSHVAVWVDDLRVTEGFSIMLTGNGGTVTFVVPPAEGSRIAIIRDVPFTQETDIQNNAAFLPEVIEEALDKLTMQAQQLREAVGRSIQSGVNADNPNEMLESIYKAANNAKSSEQSAKASANDAAEYSDAAKQSANNAASSEQSAKSSAGEAANAAAKELAKYLPLAGGEMTGVIYVPANGGFRTKHGKDVFLLAGSQWEGSARVILRGQESEIDPGGVAISASGSDGDKTLTLYTDGRIRFADKDVECVTSWHSGNKWYRKYADGLIIQGGTANGPTIGNDGYDQKVNLSTPFTGTDYQVLLTYCGNKTTFDNYAHYYHIQTWSQTTTYFYHYAQEGLNCHWVAIGY